MITHYISKNHNYFLIIFIKFPNIFVYLIHKRFVLWYYRLIKSEQQGDKPMKNPKLTYIIVYILEIVLGICMLCFTKNIFNYLTLIIGGIIILFGAINILLSVLNQNKNQKTLANQAALVIGIIIIFAGIIVLIVREKVVTIIPILFGSYIIFCTLLGIRAFVALAKTGFSKWWFFLITALVLSGLGALIIYNPFKSVDITSKITGITLIIKGINDMIVLFLSYIKDSNIKNSLDTSAIAVIDVKEDQILYEDNNVAKEEFAESNNTSNIDNTDINNEAMSENTDDL